MEIYYQEQEAQSVNSKMAANDPMYNTHSYRSLDSPDDEDDNSNQRNSGTVDSFLEIDDWLNDDQESNVSEYPYHNPVYDASSAIEVGGQSIGATSSHIQGYINRGSGSGQAQKRTKEKVAFKTKSEVEILDDGFKWRKYGKKMVKNSPNPRNYYRCSVDGCSVKKRVERDIEDARYVITTYEGVHNHEGPSKF